METWIEGKKQLKKDITEWVSALRSGKYKQGRGALQSGYGYCCLGVGCEVTIPKDKQKLTSRKKYLAHGMPEEQPHAPTWLKNINDDVLKKLGNMNLTTLNDSDENYTFDEIADVLELLYIHEAIDDNDCKD